MKATRLNSLFRSVALSCAAAAGTSAFGNYVKEWNADEGAGYWEDTSSWNTLDTANNWIVVDPDSVDPEIAIDDWRAGNKAAEMTLKFRSAATTSDSSPFFVYNNAVTLAADEDSYGLTKGGDLEIAPSWGGNAALTVESGTYKFKKILIANSGKTGSLTLKGGTLRINDHEGIGSGGGNASIVIDGGYLDTCAELRIGNANTVQLKSGALRLRNANSGKIVLDGGVLRTAMSGGFFDSSAAGLEVISGEFNVLNDITPAAPFFGSGNLVKTGSKKLDLGNADLSNFTGSISVSEGTIDGMGAKIGDAYYASAQTAFDAAADGATITIYKTGEVALSKAGTFTVVAENGAALTVTGAFPYVATYENGVVTSVYGPATRPASDIISLNISNDSSYTMSGEGETETLAGKLPNNAWQNTANSDRTGVKQNDDARNGYKTGVTAWDGESQNVTTLDDVIFTWAVQGSNVANYGNTDRSPAFQGAWLARFSGQASDAAIVVQNIPYEKYDVIVYLSGNDTASDMRVVCVNGVPYQGDANNGAVAVSNKSAGWGNRQDALELGKNVLMLKGLTGGDLSLNMKDATYYGISAVQIVRDMKSKGSNVLSVRKVISVNMLSKYTDGFKSATYGLERVPSAAWTEDGKNSASSGGATISTGIKEWNGATQETVELSGVTITEKAGNSYNCSGHNGFGSYVPFYNLLNGYLDDSSNEVRVNNVPYKTYDVIVYTATDTANATFGPVSVNGTPYKYDIGSMSTVKATASTAQSYTAWGYSHGSVPGYGANALRITGQTSQELVISGANKSGTIRGGIAGFQIVDTTEYVNIADGGQLVIDREVAAIPAKQIVCDGSLTVVGTESYKATSADLEKIDFSQVTGTVTLGANTSYDLGVERSMEATPFAFAEGYTVNATETHKEFGNGSFSASVSEGITRVCLTRLDGSVETIDVVDGVAKFGDGAVAIDGAATIFDATFTNTTALAYKVVSGAGVGTDSTATYDKGADDPTAGMYIKHHPWISGAGKEFNALGDFTAVVVGQMSPTAKTQFIHIGSSNDSNKGLIIATTSNKDEVIITTNTGGAVDEVNAVRATVPNAASARHAYVIIKEGQTFTVWVDGVRRGAFTVPEGFKLGASNNCGLQVGSDFGGVIKNSGSSDKYAAVADNENETGVVNVIRIFDYPISEAQAEAVVTAYPYVSEGGLYTRTVTGETNFSTEGAWAKAGSEETFAVPEGAEVGGIHYNPSASLTVEGDSAVTVNASVTIDKLTVAGTGTATFKKSGESAIKVADAAIVNSPIVVEYGALDLAGTPVQIGSAGSLKFDCAAIDVAPIYAVTRFQLTGLVDRDDEKITVTMPAAAASRTVETVYNANGYYELVVTPDHAAGSEVYYKSGYFGRLTDAAFAVVLADGETATVVFPGDTVVIDDKSTQDPVYFGALPLNVSTLRVRRNVKFSEGEDYSPILGGATVTVDDGCTLTIQRNWNDITLGSVAFNGGAVVLDNNDGSLSISGAVSGTSPISVAAGRAVTVASTGSIAQALTLKEGATLTVMGDATVTQPTTDVENFEVKETEIEGGKVYTAVEVQQGFPGGDDGKTFSIDAEEQAALETVLEGGGKTLTDTASEATGLTYAQAYALGLLNEESGTLEKDVTPTIELKDGKVVVSLDADAKDAYKVTLTVYESTSLSATAEWTVKATYELGSDDEAAGFEPAGSDAGFYKVGVTIEDK